MDAASWLRDLEELPTGVWSEYMRRQDPFKAHVDCEGYRTLFDRCAVEGQSLVGRCFEQWKTSDPLELLRQRGIRVEGVGREETNLSEVTFAAFVEPSTVIWRRDAVSRAQGIADDALGQGTLDVRSLLLAHELFHVLVFQGDCGPFACGTTKVDVGGLGPFRRTCALPSLEEVEAMEFARGFVMPCIEPYALNVILLDTMSDRMAREQYEAIMGIGESLGFEVRADGKDSACRG